MPKFIRYIFLCILAVFANVIPHWYYSPKNLASSPNHIDRFFDLPAGVVSDFTVYDELHSQGPTTFSFGQNVYWLHIQNSQSLGEAIVKSGGEAKDSTWVLIKGQGNYRGKLTVYKSNNTAILVYDEINPK